MAASGLEAARAAKLGALLSRRRARELNEAGRVFLDSGLPAKAVRCFEAAVAQCVGHAAAWHNLGVATLLLANQAKSSAIGDHASLRRDALNHFLAALRLRPGFTAAAANASALQLQADQPAAACETAARGLLPSTSLDTGAPTRAKCSGDALDDLVLALEADAPAVAARCIGDEAALRAAANLATALRMAGRHVAAVSLWRAMLGMGLCSSGSTEAAAPQAAAPTAGGPSAAHHAPCSAAPMTDEMPHRVVFVCARWGDKYGSQYIGSLVRGLERSRVAWGAGTTVAPDSSASYGPVACWRRGHIFASFVCVTDDVASAMAAASCATEMSTAVVAFADLDDAEAACGSGSDAAGAASGDPRGGGVGGAWRGWWNKARLLGAGATRRLRAAAAVDDDQDAMAVFLDLDVVVTGCLSSVVHSCLDLLDGGCDIVALGTDGMACEGRAGGVNSSVMAWKLARAEDCERPPHAAALDCLVGAGCKAAMSVVHRFDHWLEIVCPLSLGGQSSTLESAPGSPCLRMGRLRCGRGYEVADYTALAASTNPARLPALVVFPLEPKPERLLELGGNGDGLESRLARLWA